MLNVDTHVLMDALRGDPRPRERSKVVPLA